MSNAFKQKGHETFTIDFNDTFKPDMCIDILELSAEMIIDTFGRPDVIWASPDCTTYTIAAISHHRYRSEDGMLLPKSDYAKYCDKVNRHFLNLIKELQPKFYLIENPRGGFRKMDFIKDFPRYTITYCQYGDTRMKPTDIWTNHPQPDFLPMCKRGSPCHESAPRGSKTGTQGLKNASERAKIPKALCEHICEICERYIES